MPPNPIVIFYQYLERTKGQYIRKCYLEQDLLFLACVQPPLPSDFFKRKIALKRGPNLEDRTAQTHPKSTGILRGNDYHRCYLQSCNLIALTSAFHYNMN